METPRCSTCYKEAKKLTEYGYYTIAGHIVCAGCYKHPNAAWKVIEANEQEKFVLLSWA